MSKRIVIGLGVFALVIIAAITLMMRPSAPPADTPADSAPARPDYAKWALLVVSGDNRAHSGAPSPVFDNARHDLIKAFDRMGFSPDNTQQFAVNFEYGVQPAEIVSIAENFRDLAEKATAGCLVYFTSHGAPTGIVVGSSLATPGMISRLVNNACGQKPTVVVMSSCYSGQFVQPLSGPNRVVLTASRPDRTSFGCGELDHYTYFDDCFMRAIPHADDFAGLGEQVQACVTAREQETGAKPPSEPQLSVGPNVMYTLRYK